MRFTENISPAWRFAKGEHIADEAQDFRLINLPHTWNAHDGQDGGSDYWRGKGSYRKRIQRPDVPEDYRIFIEFEGVNSVAEVYADGKLIKEHKGGYSAFRADITEELRKGYADLAVIADNSHRSDVYPQVADFTFYGGIYRDVWLIAVPETHISLDYYGGPGFFYTTDIDESYESGTMRISAWVENPGPYDRLHIMLDYEDEREADFYIRARQESHAEIRLDEIVLWHPDAPELYDLEISLERHNDILDSVSCRAGFRTFRADPQKGSFINDEPIALRGVSRHQDMPGRGNALVPEDHIRDAVLIKELGANTVRLAHYQHSRIFYDACDELGLAVWAEIPFISVMSDDPAAHENCRQQLTELIVQNINHPSIIVWGISNEITIGGVKEKMADNLRDLNALAKELDPSRPTVMAQLSTLPIDSELNRITDIVSYNIYYGWYGGTFADNEKWIDEFHKANPDIPLGISEYGAEGIISWHSDEPRCRDYSEEYQAEYHEHMAKIIGERPWLWATHVWNMFDFGADNRDEGGVKGRNNKGLMTFDRKIMKDSGYLYKSYWAEEPFAHIAGKRYPERPYGKMTVKVYSNEDEVTLYANGTEIASEEGSRVFIFRDVPLEIGANRIEAFTEDSYDSAIFFRVSQADPAYVLSDEEEEGQEGARNWFADLPDTPPTLTFNEGFYSIKDKVGDIIANDEAAAVITLALEKASGMKLKKSMLAMISSQPLTDAAGLLGTADRKKIDDALAYINAYLQKIKK